MIGVLQVIQALIGHADEFVGAVAILRKIGVAVIHDDGNGELKREQRFGENVANAAAERGGLSGVGLRKKNGELIAANAKSGIGSAQGFAQSSGRGEKHFIAARMAVAVVDFLEAMQIENDEAKGKGIATRAIEFFFESFGKKAAIVEAGQRVRDGTQLQAFEFIVFDDDGNTEHAGGGEDVHERRFERHGAAEMFGKIATTDESFIPQLKALAFAQLEMGDGAKIALEKLTASGQIQIFKSIRQQVEKGILDRQTGGRWSAGAGHIRSTPAGISPRGMGKAK